MKKATVNFWVDAAIGVAFLLCATTGIFLFLPVTWRGVSAGGLPTLLWIPLSSWRFVHDWSGIVMTGGIVLHAVLHYRWIVNMTRRVLSGASASARPSSRQAARPQVVTQDAATPVSVYRSEQGRGHTRKAFLTGIAAAGGLALLGVTLLRREGPSGSTSTSPASLQSQGSGNGGEESGDGGQASHGQPQGANGASQGGSTQSGSGAVATTQRVVVDRNGCVSCGSCLQVCPAGVFGWSGGTAAAQNPDGCVGCRRCLQACPAGAITVNA